MEEYTYRLNDVCYVVKNDIFKEKSRGKDHAVKLIDELKSKGIEGRVTDSQLSEAITSLKDKYPCDSFHYLLDNVSFPELIRDYKHNRNRRLGKISFGFALSLFVIYQILSNYIKPNQQKQNTRQKAAQELVKEKPQEEIYTGQETGGKKRHLDFGELLTALNIAYNLYKNDEEMKDRLHSIRSDLLGKDDVKKENAKNELEKIVEEAGIYQTLSK